MHILLVEDSLMTARSLARALGSEGHAVDHAKDAIEAKDLLVQAAYDAVIADFGLGDGETGLDVLTFTRANFPATGCVLISGAVARHEVSGDWFAFLAKPFRRAELFDALGALPLFGGDVQGPAGSSDSD